MKPLTLSHKFVDAIPGKLEERTLYIAMDYATVVHKCCCGCGQEIVTPLSPTDWKLTYDGVSVSLSPSIGNWSFKCQSHYWIVRNAVHWAGRWSPEEIEAGRANDRRVKQVHYGFGSKSTARPAPQKQLALWSRLWRWMTKS